MGVGVINNFEYFKNKLIEITINNTLLNLNFTGKCWSDIISFIMIFWKCGVKKNTTLSEQFQNPIEKS